MIERLNFVPQEAGVKNGNIERDEKGRLPEQKLFDLLASIGNAENKALELIAMWNGGVAREVFTLGSLFNRVMDHQTKAGGCTMDNSVPFSHCKKSFVPIGLVAREHILGGTEWGYQITDFGIKEGVPFAGLLLKWSSEHPELSLYKIFGSTASHTLKGEEDQAKKRSPEARYAILYELVTFPAGKTIMLKDIMDAGERSNGSMSTHVHNLSKNGVFAYESADKGRPSSYFRAKENAPKEDPKPYGTLPTLTQRLWSILKSLPGDFMSREQVLLEFARQYPKEKIPDDSSVSLILNHLQRERYLKRKKFSMEFRSEIKLSDAQKATIESLIDVIDKFASGDKATVEQGKAFAREVFTDKDLFTALMLKAKDASPQANALSKEEMNSNILAILRENPRATVKEIREIFIKRYKNISRVVIDVFLFNLRSQEKITAEKSKQGNRFSINPNNKPHKED